MPIYEYQCSQCGAIVERIQKVGDKQLRTCPECSGRMSKLVSRMSFQLKGGGWYEQGYSKGTPSKPQGSSTDKSGDGSDKGSDKGLISSKSFRRLHTDTGKSGYVAGWGIGKRRWAKGEIWTHTGSDGTWFSVVWAAPKLDLVLLAVSNSGTGAKACDQAVVKLLKGLKIL